MVDLRNKVVVISGGARDIGRAVSVEVAKCGASVTFCYPPFEAEEEAERTKKDVEQFGQKCVAMPVDVMEADQIAAFASTVEGTFKNIDVLVNVVGGLGGRKTVAEMDLNFWNTIVALNLTSTFLMSKCFLPMLRDGGSIVNFSSQAGRDGGGPGSLAYASAKGGIVTFTRGLARELGPRRIRVNAVAPGMINTTFHNTFTKPEVRQRVASMTPLGREGEACEVAKLVAYLASEEASFINGANVDINGGVLFS
ncbi:MAG TPA: SDR family oxidoreductase [Clostridia bacterium]|nr:SDR family oxidoreductase [Clostridia bacterium]